MPVNYSNGRYRHPSLLFRRKPWGTAGDHTSSGTKRYEYYHTFLKKGFAYRGNAYGLLPIRNPIAAPDLLISRINARNISYSISPLVFGGLQLNRWHWKLKTGDPCSNPSGYSELVKLLRSYSLLPSGGVLDISNIVVHDPYLEREVIQSYFDRNHGYRTGNVGVEKIGGLSAAGKDDDWGHDFQSPPVGHQMAFRKFWSSDKSRPLKWDKVKQRMVGPLVAYAKVEASYDDALDWLREPALLRTYESHGLADSLATSPKYDCGCYRWAKRPLHFGDMREVYEQNRLGVFRKEKRNPEENASFYYLIGSYNSAPTNARILEYNSQAYAPEQIAEAFLFFGEGLALISRAHSYHQHPGVNIPEWNASEELPLDTYSYTLLRGYSYGEVWRAMFEAHRAYYYLLNGKEVTYKHPNKRKERKDPYRMVVLGDWTLRLNDYEDAPSP